MMLRIVVTIIEKGPIQDFIIPREAPRIRKKMLKRSMMPSVPPMGDSIALAENGCNKNGQFERIVLI